MSQQIINYGAAPNDGTGDPLRTAFVKTDNNFDQIWAAGPVGSNVNIANSTISVVSTNGNLVLNPNGVGIIQTNNSLVPRANRTYDIGTAALQYRTVYANAVSANTLSLSGSQSISGDLTVAGNLIVEGDTIQIGNITTDTKTIQLSNSASNAAAANFSGVTVGANDNIATLLYNATSNTWTTNIGVTVSGNLSAGNMSATLLAGTLTTASQPNITSLGTLVNLSVTGNVTANYFVGNGSLLTGVSNYANANAVSYAESGWSGNIIPSANAVYSLGNASNQWSNLWVANNTIYLGGVPLGIGTGNVLTVGGEPILSNDSNTSITTTGDITAGNVNATDNVIANGIVQGNVITADSAINTAGTIAATGNITAGNIISDGEIISNGRAYVRYLDIRGGQPSGTIGSLGYSGNIPQLYGTAGIQITTSDGEGGPQWEFDTSGTMTAPGNITTTGNITTGNILTDNYLYANGEPFVSASTGNITFTDTTMSPPDGVDITISAANSEVKIEAFDIRLDATDDLRLTGNDIVSLRNRSTTDPITIRTDYDNNDYAWEFAADGTLTTPGDIITAGDVTGTAGASTLYFKAQPASNTYIQLNNSVDSVISTVANLEVRTDVSNTAQVWSFDTTGNLTAPGNITASGNITGNFILADLQVIATGDVTGSNIVGISSVQTANVYATDSVSATGNVIGGNLVTTGQVAATGNISGANFLGNIAAANVVGTVSSATTAGTVTTAAQANITSLGNLSSLTMAGNISGVGTSNSTPPQSVTISAGDNTGGDLFNAANGGTLTLRGGDSGFNPGGALQLRGGNGSVDGDIIIGDITTTSVKIGNTSITANVVGNLTVGTNASVTGNITTGNILTDNYRYANGDPFVSSNYGDSNVVTLLSSFGSNTVSTTGNITAANFIGNVSLTGNITGTSANVDLIAGSYTWTFDNTGIASFPAVGGQEGGEINLAIPTANTTLTGPVKVDVYQDRLRFFDGSTNGAYIDLANCPSGVSAAIGYRDIPQISLSANVTANATNAGRHFYSTTAGNLQLTIPDNANVAFPTGATLTIVVNAAGNVIVAQGTGVSLYMVGSSSTGNRTVGAYGLASVMKVATDTWVISGTGVY